MKLRNAFSCSVLVCSFLCVKAQTPPAPRPDPTVVAGIPVNYDEACRSGSTSIRPKPLPFGAGILVLVFASHTSPGVIPASSTAFCTAPKLMEKNMGTGFRAVAGR